MKTKDMTQVALMTAVICIVAPLTIPLPFTAIPFSLTPFAICLISSLLGMKRGGISVALYILIGTVGVPVFSGYQGGFQKLIGPTGGFFIGYLVLALITGFSAERFFGKIYMYIIGMLLGLTICYIFGAAWFSLQQGVSIKAAFAGAVIPFIPLDLVKVFLAAAFAYPIRSRIARQVSA